MSDEDYNVIEFEFGKFIEHIYDAIDEIDLQELADFLKSEAEYYEEEAIREAEESDEDPDEVSENEDE